LTEVLGEIRAKRAAIRAARGWVMDTYLLRPT
jgi:precorrin-6A synthase